MASCPTIQRLAQQFGRGCELSNTHNHVYYDPVKHLSTALFPFDAKEKVMVMLTGYFDESYNQATSENPDVPLVYTIAGCVGLGRQWVKFQKKWKAALDREVLSKWQEVYGKDKPIFFHMKDFDNPHSKIYGDWSKDKKVKFLRELHSIMAKHSLRRFATAIIVAEHQELTTEEQYVFGHPHICAAINCVKRVAEWAKRANYLEPILYVFEKGSVHDKEMRRLFEKTLSDDEKSFYGINKLAIEDKRNLSPLQAADIIAFETRKEHCRQLDKNKARRERGSIRNLHVPALDEWYVMGREHFRQVLDRPDVREKMAAPEFRAAAAEDKRKGLF